ncbi:transporter substrate-binding domain-containing protein [Brucella intermedia]|uniref:transporter substrate-binding domain-containing protein n=1 Tax=Brucella intermedia TaxID=94625 RepID=UPI00224B7687|nr:transporter substrate-binding domain-containing protein [Brucella intermedia]
MNIGRFIKLIAAGLIASFALFGAAHAQSLDDIVKRGKLLVAIDTTYAPFGTINEKMEPDGFEVQLAKEMAAALGVQAEVVPVNTANRIPVLLTNKADITLSTLAITPQRAAQVMFSIPYSGVKFQIITEKSRAIKGPADLASLKVGVIRGGAAEGPLKAVAPEGTTIVQFDDVAGCVQGLLSGQVDAIAEGWLLPAKMNQTAGSEKFEAKFDLGESHYGMAVRRGSFDLLQWINTFIYTYNTNGKLAELHQRYIQLPLPSLPSF